MPRESPTRDDSASEPYSDELAVSSPSILDTAADGTAHVHSGSASDGEHSAHHDSDADSDSDSESHSESGSEREHARPDGKAHRLHAQLSTVSFGALAAARRAADRSGGASALRAKSNEGGGARSDERALEALRERLREMRRGGGALATGVGARREGGSVGAGEGVDGDAVGDGSEVEDGSASEGEGRKGGRSSKHAPAEQSSKRPVTRKRTVVELPKSTARDPRFDPLAGRLNEDGIKKKYAFLAEYQKSELAELKAALKAKNKLSDAERDGLKRKILSIESRQKAANAKEAEKEVQRQHRKKEQELVKQGKKPFFLKKSEVKKQALVKKFESMKGKERDRAIERRRRKLAARERRHMPDTRRG